MRVAIILRFVFAVSSFLFGGSVHGEPHSSGSGELNQCDSFELIREHRLGPGQPLFGHVQGLEVTDEFFFLTAVTRSRETGFLYIYSRRGEERRRPLQQYDVWRMAQDSAKSCGALDEARLNHPSGIQVEGNLLHIAIAPSANRGPSCVMALDVSDLSSPRVAWATRVEEHIGAVVQLPSTAVIAFNWGSDDYWWLGRGESPRRIPAKEELEGRLAELLHIQDCDREGSFVYCAHSNHRDDLLKIYNAAHLGPESVTLKPRIIRIPSLGSQHGGTHEGLAWRQGRLFLLPDDGDETGVSIYELGCVAARKD